MRLLGAILAGGQSRRFGSDKAAAMLRGSTLLQWVEAALNPQVAAVMTCGGTGLADRPGGGLGPLAGLNAALHFGAEHGYDAVLLVPCDTPFLPDDLARQLLAAGAPCCVADIPVIGVWPAALAQQLDAYLADSEDRSMRGWAKHSGARQVTLAGNIANVNHRDDLDRLESSF